MDLVTDNVLYHTLTKPDYSKDIRLLDLRFESAVLSL